MFPYSYAPEKLSNAVRILAIGDGDVRSRLWSAFLVFRTLRTEDFPLNLQDGYDWIIDDLTKLKPRNQSNEFGYSDEIEWAIDGIVQANLRHMINRTGRRSAIRICDLEYQIQRAREEWRRNLAKSPIK